MNTSRAITCVVLTALVATGCVRKPVTAPPARRHVGPDLRAALGDVRTLAAGDEAGAARSPGLRYRHYAPRAQVGAYTEKRCSLGSLDARCGWAKCGLPCGPQPDTGTARFTGAKAGVGTVIAL